MRAKHLLLGSLVLVCILACAAWLHFRPAPRATGPLRQEAYLWQRAWSDPVRNALADHGSDFSRIVILSAQLSWERDADGLPKPRIFKVAPDWWQLQKTPQVGLALRISEFHGDFAGDSAHIVSALAAELCRDARAHGIQPAELQLDFDCPSSKLAGYRVWLQAIQAAVPDTPVHITALPTWLDRADFAVLAQTSGEYILQVHSLERPQKIGEAVQLCDPAAARRAVEKAARLGVPFRVALPTYGYILIFSHTGDYLGLQADEPAKPWPADAQKRWLGADAAALAELIREWSTAHPISLTGILWYRLPTEADHQNWRWPTLHAVMNGKNPTPKIDVQTKTSSDGVQELQLINSGEGELRDPLTVTVEWSEAGPIARDAQGGFAELEGTPHAWRLRGLLDLEDSLAPGEKRTIGWLRFAHPADLRTQTQITPR